MRLLLEALLALGALSALPGQAQAPPAAIPQGPVTVDANRAEWQQGGAMIYTGNVVMRSADLEMRGERLELKQLPAGEFEARLSGAPARLLQAGTDAAPPVVAQAQELFYDSQGGVVQLAGAAQIERGGDRLNGDTIRYEVAQRRIQASGGEGGQVRIVITPPAQPKGPQK
ncbi:MAG: lipopolysaccharide transport periplasmic protein LptA [Gammaproteobacteria bacterium]|nr:lipopolysaccharide transport periplasmic protein LptA [Gammaproteobacteria bacterium]